MFFNSYEKLPTISTDQTNDYLDRFSWSDLVAPGCRGQDKHSRQFIVFGVRITLNAEVIEQSVYTLHERYQYEHEQNNVVICYCHGTGTSNQVFKQVLGMYTSRVQSQHVNILTQLLTTGSALGYIKEITQAGELFVETNRSVVITLVSLYTVE